MEDLETGPFDMWVAQGQDVFHVLQRITRTLPPKTPILDAVRIAASQVLIHASPIHTSLLREPSPRELLDRCNVEVKKLETGFLNLLDTFKDQDCSRSKSDNNKLRDDLQMLAQAYKRGVKAGESDSGAVQSHSSSRHEQLTTYATESLPQFAEQGEVRHRLVPAYAWMLLHIASANGGCVQFTPNPDFGGSEAQANQVLVESRCLRKMAPQCGAEADGNVAEFISACECAGRSNHAAIDAAFFKLLPQQFPLIQPKSTAGRELQSRIPVNASNMWGLLFLGCLPSRKSHGVKPPSFVPIWLKGVHDTIKLLNAFDTDYANCQWCCMFAGAYATAVALLVARAEVKDPFDPDELMKYEGVLGDIDTDRLANSRLNAQFGTAKEAYALEAGTRALSHRLSNYVIAEGELHSCHNASRCVGVLKCILDSCLLTI